MSPELLILRILHVVLGAFWLGAGIAATVFLLPAISSKGPLVGEVMMGLEKRGYFSALALAGLITILTGLRLLWIVSDGFGAAYFARASGQVYLASAVATIAGFLLAMLVSRPAGARQAALMPKRAAAATEAERQAIDAELARLRVRGGRASTVAVALIFVAALGMAVARYL